MFFLLLATGLGLAPRPPLALWALRLRYEFRLRLVFLTIQPLAAISTANAIPN